jgi:hypothetical protein
VAALDAQLNRPAVSDLVELQALERRPTERLEPLVELVAQGLE